MRATGDHETGAFTGRGDRGAAAGPEGASSADSCSSRPRLGHTENQSRCEALFASTLQESDAPTPQAVADAISSAVRQRSPGGCASQMAQEFGDHPEEARDRMRWARQLLGHAADRYDRESDRGFLPEQRQPAERPDREEGASDAELLRRHVAGDPDAFGELFGRLRDRLWAVAVRTLGDPEEAADALQDAVIAAFRRADGFRGESAVTTWLHRIVVNAAFDRVRRRAARPTAAGQDEEALDALATGGRSLADPSGSTDTVMDVRAALQQLVPDQQAALVLVHMLGYSVADAAQMLGVSEGTVKSRTARGRARLLPGLEHLRPRPVPEQNRPAPARAAANVREPYVRGRRPGRGIAGLAGHATSGTTEVVYRHQLRPVIEKAR